MWYICAYLRRIFYYLFRDKPISTNINLFKKKKNKLFLDVVTGDKTRMNNFQPQRKFNNKVWMTKLEKSPFDAKHCRSTKGFPMLFSLIGRMLCGSFLLPRRRRVLLKRWTNVNFCTNLHSNTKTNYKNWFQGYVIAARYFSSNKSTIVTYFLSKERVTGILHSG